MSLDCQVFFFVFWVLCASRPWGHDQWWVLERRMLTKDNPSRECKPILNLGYTYLSLGDCGSWYYLRVVEANIRRHFSNAPSPTELTTASTMRFVSNVRYEQEVTLVELKKNKKIKKERQTLNCIFV